MENLNNEHEKTISGLEEDIVQLLKVSFSTVYNIPEEFLKVSFLNLLLCNINLKIKRIFC